MRPESPQQHRRGLERFTDLPLFRMVRAAGYLVGRMGPVRAYRFARWIGDAWNWIVPGRRRIALRNLEIAFPDTLSPVERKNVVRMCYRHAMATALDVFLFDRWLTPEGWRQYITLDENVKDLLVRPHPRGLAVLSAHLGNWELGLFAFALLGLPVTGIARRIHNPHLDRFGTRLRSRRGAGTIRKEGALLRMRSVLARGEAVGLMVDQCASSREPCFRFFDRRAATHFQYARLLARLRTEVVFVACVRDGFQFRFQLRARDLTDSLEGSGSVDERAERLVKSYLATVEEEIRRDPHQYLWMHRRWKVRPPGAPDLYQTPLAPPASVESGREKPS